jgi:two-component system vancomycin resistance associated response regulator VraR
MGEMRILLVDDSREFRRAASKFLSACPDVTVVGEAASGEEALNLASQLQPDAILMDLIMEEMNGLVATWHLKTGADAPLILLLSLHDNPEYRALAYSVGADGYVPKSNFCTELLPTLRNLARLRQPAPEDL